MFFVLLLFIATKILNPHQEVPAGDKYAAAVGTEPAVGKPKVDVLGSGLLSESPSTSLSQGLIEEGVVEKRVLVVECLHGSGGGGS